VERRRVRQRKFDVRSAARPWIAGSSPAMTVLFLIQYLTVTLGLDPRVHALSLRPGCEVLLRQ
jgi:hypothetical protein